MRLFTVGTCVVPVATLMLATAGALGSLYSSEIKDSINFTVTLQFLQRDWETSWITLTFLILLGVPTFALIARNAHADHSRREAEERVMNRAAELERSLRTMPPRAFLSKFAQYYDQVDVAIGLGFEDLQPVADQDSRWSVARIILQNIAALAKDFDGAPADGPQPPHYAANVMLFRARAQLTVQQRTDFQHRLRFCSHGVTVDGLEGVLELIPGLSATFQGDQIDPEVQASPIVLPVPTQETELVNGRNKFLVLPGAPMAFKLRKLSALWRVSTIRMWCDEAGEFPENVKRNLEEYFEDHPSISSFVSVPLFHSHDPNPDPQLAPFGVLNIHSNSNDLLRGDDEAVEQFLQLCRPLLLPLARLIVGPRPVEPAHPAPNDGLGGEPISTPRVDE